MTAATSLGCDRNRLLRHGDDARVGFRRILREDVVHFCAIDVKKAGRIGNERGGERRGCKLGPRGVAKRFTDLRRKRIDIDQ